MNHQPYRDWLFTLADQGDDTLTSEQVAGFQAHLDSCPECRRLQQAWQAVEADLQASLQLAPEEGFTARWITHLDLDRQRHRQRQGIYTGLVSFGLAAVIIMVLIYLAWPLLQSPGLFLWAYLYQIIRMFSLLGTLQQFMGSFFQAVNLAVSPLALLFGAGLLTILSVLWLVTLRALTNPRSVSK